MVLQLAVSIHLPLEFWCIYSNGKMIVEQNNADDSTSKERKKKHRRLNPEELSSKEGNMYADWHTANPLYEKRWHWTIHCR